MAGITTGYKKAEMETDRGEFSIILPATRYLLNTVTDSVGSKQLCRQYWLQGNAGAFTQAMEWKQFFILRNLCWI